MTSPVPPRDWTEIHWSEIAKADAARWIAVLPLAATEQHGPHLPLETDILIGEAYLARVRELLPAALPVTFLPVQPIGISTEHIDFPARRRCRPASRLKEWMAIGESAARIGHPQAGDRDQPWRQQRGDVAGRAGFARASSDARRHHQLVSLRHPGRIVFGRRDRGTAFMAARPRRRSCWRAIRSTCATRPSPISVPPASPWRRNFAGCRRTGRSPFAWQTQDLHRQRRGGRCHQGHRREGRSDCSITPRARSANCSTTSTNSISNCFFVNHKARHLSVSILK